MNNKRLEQLISILNQGSKDPFIKYAIATEYLKEQNIPLALKFYEDLVSSHPDYIGTYYHLGKLYSLGRKQKAKSTFEQGMVQATQKNELHALSELQQIYQVLILESE